MDESSLYKLVGRIARNSGADLWGVADLWSVQKEVKQQGGEYVGSFPRAVSIGIRLLDAIVDGLKRHDDPTTIYTYRGLYNSVNACLDQIVLKIAREIQNSGFRAFPVPASQTIDKKRFLGAVSHKLVANLAGLGWIGKNCLLITPKHGPRVRLATVLTDAPIRTGSPIKTQCGKCRECVDVCPAKAFTGIPFNPAEPREMRFNAHACREYSRKREEKMGEGLCGLCIYVCPHGKKSELRKLN